MTSLKAFCVGLPKSATTTLHLALTRSGWVSAHWEHNGNRVGKQIYRAFEAGKDPISLLSDCDAITQADFIANGVSLWPQTDAVLLKEIQRHHPSCRFLLPVRDPVKVTNSICRWLDLQERLVKFGAPGLPPGKASAPAAIEAWIRSHNDFCRSFFQGDNRFLEYDVEAPDAPEIVGRHLGIEIKWWGVTNQIADAPTTGGPSAPRNWKTVIRRRWRRWSGGRAKVASAD